MSVASVRGVSAPLLVAAVQMQSGAVLEGNLASVRTLVAQAVVRGATLVVLPENFALMGADERAKCEIAEDVEAGQGPIVQTLRALAREHAITLVGGGMPEASADRARPFNTAVVFGAGGQLLAKYRKIHLFDVDLAAGEVYRESAHTSAGDQAVMAEIPCSPQPAISLGLSVCYDVRFPELYRVLAQRGAHGLVVPAAFTLHTGKDHWHPLLRARAIENQCFVIAAAQHGQHPRGRVTYGKSVIVDAWGDVLAQAADGAGVCVAAIDLAQQAQIRAAMPVSRHRKL